MSYVIQAVLSNAQHPEYGQVTIPFPIPNQNYDCTIGGYITYMIVIIHMYTPEFATKLIAAAMVLLQEKQQNAKWKITYIAML